ncbi:uncharacterized protein BT62DRAFT_932046 [Guyanagaster necrorhizus]|uniref:Uncharacterized protein n=1 Tax=Guyanagaster necrorhizus TaxID=856835 RepID=A0A9P7VU38_9AGAR|nr:uncharacterized protein BT62DRAFT_932046 [Guyanagaster necrorhizus MCA 3950]KAG7446607.1 hypothetical protein BT62DRAFT_932046 [Guyanagaster necrorhizus MCA 3950]
MWCTQKSLYPIPVCSQSSCVMQTLLNLPHKLAKPEVKVYTFHPTAPSENPPCHFVVPLLRDPTESVAKLVPAIQHLITECY